VGHVIYLPLPGHTCLQRQRQTQAPDY
jgi:hypothetical protein